MKFLKQAAHYFNQLPTSWGVGSSINAMMESREYVSQKIRQRKQWETRYGEIARNYDKTLNG